MAEKGTFGELLGQRRAGHPQRLHARRRHVRRRALSGRRSSPRSTSSTSIPAAASTSPSSAWANSTPRATSTSRCSATSIVGPGGFVDITQGARKVVFCGTFEAKGLEVAVEDGRLAHPLSGQHPEAGRQGAPHHLQRRPRPRDRPGGALRHRARRLQARRAGSSSPRSRPASTSKPTCSAGWAFGRSFGRRGRCRCEVSRP